jgi:hypothetical protein
MGAIIDRNANYGDDQTAVADITNSSGVESDLIVGTTAVEIKVGATRLTGRKLVTFYNNSNNTIFWGYNNTVTIATGTPILKGQGASWEIGDALGVYVISGSNNNNTRITEGG